MESWRTTMDGDSATSQANSEGPPSTTSDARRPPLRALPFSEASRELVPPFIAKLLFGVPLAPRRDEWTIIESALYRGDPAMDEVVEWMFAAGPGASRRLFEQALTQGIHSLRDPPDALRKFFALIDTPPVWVDRELLARGVDPAQRSGAVGFQVHRDLALMAGYSYFNSMNQVLIRTGALERHTSLRMGETKKWIHDVGERGGLERFKPGFITTIRVRLVHALVRRSISRRDDWDHAKWGLPINQVDMQATYLAFGPFSLLGMRLFGVYISRRDAEAHVHMWRYIGWLLGVEEALLAHTEKDGLRKVHHTFLTHRLPDGSVRRLGQALRDEPLHRKLPEPLQSSRWADLYRRFLYHQHLSNSSVLLGPQRRKELGLPLSTLPWNPVLSAPFRFAFLCSLRLLGKRALYAYQDRARAGQERRLAGYFGGDEAHIIRPAEGHPAHADQVDEGPRTGGGAR